MDVYVFQAALLCSDCGERAQSDHALECFEEDSDRYLQGPCSDGGGEADVPQCCDHCGVFLENPLTGDGYNYVREMAQDKSSASNVIREWLEFYEIRD